MEGEGKRMMTRGKKEGEGSVPYFSDSIASANY